MLKQILEHKDYSSKGHHDDENRAVPLVADLIQFRNLMPSEHVVVPDWLIKASLGVLSDIIDGYERPLHYLCSDCRYPKWRRTEAELKEQYPKCKELHITGLDGFGGSFACPKCGD